MKSIFAASIPFITDAKIKLSKIDFFICLVWKLLLKYFRHPNYLHALGMALQIHLVVFIATMTLGGVTYIGLEPQPHFRTSTPTFIGLETVEHWIIPNIWIGPHFKFFIGKAILCHYVGTNQKGRICQ